MPNLRAQVGFSPPPDGYLVDDGSYTVRIIALDDAGNSCERTYGIQVDTQLPVITEVGLDQSGTMSFINPFSPNDDGVSDFTTFWFKLSGAWPEQTKIKIYRGTTLMRTLYGAGSEATSDVDIEPWPNDSAKDEAAQNGYNWAKWNGLDDDGKLVPDGSYYYEIWATDRAGNRTSIEGKVVVDTQPPEVSITFIADNDGNEGTYFNNSSSLPLKISGTASDLSGVKNIHLVIDDGYFVPNNPQGNWSTWSLSWTPDEGEYTIQAWAEDTVGNSTGNTGPTKEIVYDTTSPEFSWAKFTASNQLLFPEMGWIPLSSP